MQVVEQLIIFGGCNMDISRIIIHENKEDYQPDEVAMLEQAYLSLTAKSQGEEISLEETRIIVAYKRYKQEGNFKIVAEKAKKAPKEPSAAKPAKEKKPKALTKKERELLTTIKDLLEGGQITIESLPEEKRTFYETNKERL